ncbi:alpha/beta hydrolase family protein [Acinetobacter silvestris]|uniref:Alpha/beta hydrolase n=1 Tax=Acinetobacter silvestris TaxID=1977882 RepID=A0A1Y3CHP7_9GAMM|nr:prolyl oligopeptidase family serine peptidase [Acinetobacter silvestris]OTG65422.1 alpha/beta hydrolase [Acinetobacter silvestris]
MKHILKRSLLAMSCSAIFFLTACNDSNDDYVGVTPSQTFISEKNYVFDKSLAEAASIKVMTYNMVNVKGKTAKATAMVLFPTVAQPKDGYRVVVWEHGTLGVADDCAPTNNILGTNFKDPLAKSLLAAGYVIVAPDYEGMGVPGIHPYLHLESEAKSAIAAVKAAQDHYGNVLNKQWMSAGQSQGGQASLGTAQYANADLNYKGAVAGAPASSLDKIIFDVAPPALLAAENKELAAGATLAYRAENGSIGAYATLLSYAAFAAVGIKASDSGFDYREIFNDVRSQNIAALAEGTNGDNGLCLSSSDPINHPEDSLRYRFTKDIVAFLTENPTKRLLDYPGLNKDKFYASAQIQKFLKESQPATVKIDKPILIIQGTADMSVPYPVTEAMYKAMLAQGTNVKFLPVLDATHTQAIVKKNPELVAFIQQYMPAS